MGFSEKSINEYLVEIERLRRENEENFESKICNDKLWAESQSGKGSTFSISFPKV